MNLKKICFAFLLLFTNASFVNAQSKDSLFTVYYKTTSYQIDSVQYQNLKSLLYVDELARMLKTNFKMENFEIIGHVNYQSTKDSSQLQDLYYLSERRAKAIYNLLAEKGISPERMRYKGVGNSQPLFPQPANDEERKKNMRVQIVILKPGQ